jgi:hypothetical protein
MQAEKAEYELKLNFQLMRGAGVVEVFSYLGTQV